LCGYPRDLRPWAEELSGGAKHAWIAADGVVRLVPAARLRRRHVGVVDLVADGEGRALLAAAVDLADRWSPVDRLELDLPADHPALPAALDLGFEVEIARRARTSDGRDELALGRLRTGFTPRATAPVPTWPARGPKGPGAFTYRPATEADAPAIAKLSTEPLGRFGTLQIPSSSVAFYADRGAKTPPGAVAPLMFDGPELIGSGGVFPSLVPDVAVLGMMIATAAQGRGAGRALLDHLIAVAREAGFRRFELGVYVDNDRAVRLYTSAGFVDEGAKRYDTIRDGGHACTREMAMAPR
jgi:L-phenylalanine/L-methionine N-acetyltransferase